ncbi:MAG: dicarboxylate/amino acid:cation symporter [Persicimonas sp.]
MSDDHRPWYKELHWQILLGLVLALIYALVVRQVVGVPASGEVEAAGQTATSAASSVVHGGVDVAQQRAAAIAELQPWRAPFSFVGDLFIRLLMLIIIPLIMTSVVTGIQSLGTPSRLGRLGAWTIGYYLATSFLAVIIGLGVVNLLEPGKGLGLSVEGDPQLSPTPLSEVFLNIVPENIFGAMAAGQMLPTIFVAIGLGLALLLAGERAALIGRFFDEANELVMMITGWIMATAPVGVAALFASTLLDPNLADLTQFFSDMGMYMAAVVGGLSIHAFVVLPLLLLLVAGIRPIKYLAALAPALLTAFSTASSSATFPLTLECVTERAGVDRESADFVLPLGATLNMDGTALYEAVAAVFIANALGFDLTFAQQVVIVLTATLAAIGAAGVPSAGLVTMIIVLESVGLPGAGYALVVAVDRILDMCRTTVNVWGDSVGAAVVDRLLGDPEAKA